VFLPERGWSRNQTLPESADDRRATQLHHVRGRHRVKFPLARMLSRSPLVETPVSGGSL